MSVVCLSKVQAATATPAGAQVLNTAEVAFTLGGGEVAVVSNTVTTRLDEVLDVSVVALQNSTSGVAPGAVDQALGFKVTNTGNGREAFALSAASVAMGFAPVVKRIVVDSDGDGVLGPADQTYTGDASAPMLSAGQSLTIWVVCDIPAGAAGAGAVKLTASDMTGHGAPGAVFFGKGEGGGDAVVGQTGALASAQSSIKVGGPATASIDMSSVTLVKSQTVTDILGGSRPLTGSTITYRLDARFAATGVINGAHLTDAVPVGTTVVPGSLRLDGASVNDAVGFSATGVDVALGDLAGPAEHVLTFQVRIN